MLHRPSSWGDSLLPSICVGALLGCFFLLSSHSSYRSVGGGARAFSSHQGMASGHDHSMHSSMGSGMDGGGGDMDMAMPMYFTNSLHSTLWFKPWMTTSGFTYACALLGLFLCGVLHEAVATYRSLTLARLKGRMGGGGGSALEEALAIDKTAFSIDLRQRLFQAALYTANIASGFMLMLAVMTFNVGFFFAVVLGMGTGYFVFMDKMAGGAMQRAESCHVRLLD